MILAEVDIIIEPRASIVRFAKVLAHHRTNDRIDGKERTEKDDVFLRHLRQSYVQQICGMVFIELVLRVVMFVQKSQRDMRLGIRMAAHILVRDTVPTQEMANHIAYMVTSRLRNHGACHSGATQRHDAVEGRTARHGFLRLVILEQDIQHRFSYSDYA